jgi:hypothetical protein
VTISGIGASTLRRTVMIHSENYKGYVIELWHDPDPENPRKDWDNATDMICFHTRYNLGDDDHGLEMDHFNSWEGLRAHLEIDSVVVVPVYLYDHSGLTINTTGFSCPWDSGQIGFIRVSRETANREWPDATEEELESYCVKDVEVYDKFLRGLVYGFKVLDHCGEVQESCWGFYSEEDALDEARVYVGLVLV